MVYGLSYRSGITLKPNRAASKTVTPEEQGYYWAYIAALVMCWSPWKILAYAAPFFSIGIFILFSPRTRAVANIFLFVAGASVWLAVWIFLANWFVLTGGLLWLITYGAFAFVAIIPNRNIGTLQLSNRMLKITRRVVFFEACAGLIQGTYGALKSGTFDSANGDIVQGTIYPFLRGDGAFANPMFSASMILLMLALLTDTSRNRANYLALCLGIVSVIVASVLHQLVFLFGALAGSYIIIRPKIPFSRGFLPMAALLGLIPILVIGLLSQNLGSFGETIGQFSRGESPRRIILDTVLFDMHREYPLMPVIGVGPGQFSSRAALINSGYYLGSPLGAREVSFFIRGEVAAPLAKYLLPLWIATAGNVFYGSTQKPYFSWLSVYSELGAVGLLFILVVACIIARRTIRSRRIGIAGMLQFGLLAAILFTLFLGAQENYFEVPQALLPGFIILKALYARAVSRNEFNSSQNLRFRRNHPSSSPLRLSQHQLAPLYSRVYGLPGVGSTRQCGLGDTVPEP